jgi:iron complex transport system substrate-binding protein
MTLLRLIFTALALLATLGAQAAIEVRDDRGVAVRLQQPAHRIVTLLPSLTETVCALDACDRLVATDRYSDWPAAVQALPKVGGMEDAQIERIVALHPDLVLAAVSTRAVERLTALGLTVATLEPKNHADTQRVIRAVALLLGRSAAGEALWTQAQSKIDAAAARVPPAWKRRQVYFEVESSPYAAGAGSFIGETLQRLGLGNIVPAELGPFPKLNPEFVVRAQPDLVIASERELEGMAQRPGWSALRALQHGQVCRFANGPYEMLIRPGPRLGEAAQRIADCLAHLPLPHGPGAAH